jgi:hypothetical protein
VFAVSSRRSAAALDARFRFRLEKPRTRPMPFQPATASCRPRLAKQPGPPSSMWNLGYPAGARRGSTGARRGRLCPSHPTPDTRHPTQGLSTMQRSREMPLAGPGWQTNRGYPCYPVCYTNRGYSAWQASCGPRLAKQPGLPCLL